MRGRATIAAAMMLIAIPTIADAKGRPEPLDVRQGTAVGRAADTNSLNGIYVSPVDGNVYVASVGGDEITVHDTQNGKVLDRLGPESGVRGPDDLFIADDGTIYWTEILTGFVGMLKPDGTFMREFVGQGVNPITMSDDGRLFVGRLFFGSGLYELDADFEGDPVLLDGSLNINSFDFGPDGHLYAPAQFTGEIVKIDVDAPVPVGSTTIATGFRAPTAAKFNSLGELHVGDLAEGQVFKLDLNTGDREVLIDIEGTIDNIAFGADDRLYAAAGSDNQIVRYDSGRVKALGQPGLGSPGGVAVSPDGTVWVAEFFALRGIDKNPRKFATSFYDRFDLPGDGFAGASTVAPDGDNLIISSGFSGAVQVLDPATGAIVFDTRALATPTNALRHGDTLVAAQLGVAPGPASVVNVDDPSEVFIENTPSTPLFVPLGLASDGDTLYVGDWATGIVWAITDTVTRPLAFGLMGLEGLAVDGDRLLAVETGRQQVTAIDLATGQQSVVIDGFDFSARVPEGFFPFGSMSGVAVGTDNSIFVSDDGVNTVYRFRRPG
jgi:outer membrane protein assembly factor BamB